MSFACAPQPSADWARYGSAMTGRWRTSGMTTMATGLKLKSSQRSLLTALARERTAEFTEDYRRRNGLSVSATVHAALKVLVNAGLVEREDTTYRVGDPFFARFLRTSPWQ